jgi:hypothetical protein
MEVVECGEDGSALEEASHSMSIAMTKDLRCYYNTEG